MKRNQEELMKNLEDDLDLIFRRIGHQLKIHRTWILKQSEEEIIRFVKVMGFQVLPKTKVLKSLLTKN
jgi:glutathione synthase/RimK-type ligase-like ATP-grasp enzyme